MSATTVPIPPAAPPGKCRGCARAQAVARGLCLGCWHKVLTACCTSRGGAKTRHSAAIAVGLVAAPARGCWNRRPPRPADLAAAAEVWAHLRAGTWYPRRRTRACRKVEGPLHGPLPDELPPASPAPTAARPGTIDKMAVLAARVAAGRPVCDPEDVIPDGDPAPRAAPPAKE